MPERLVGEPPESDLADKERTLQNRLLHARKEFEEKAAELRRTVETVRAGGTPDATGMITRAARAQQIASRQYADALRIFTDFILTNRAGSR